ncbi:hypothetical protein [Nocardia alni]|uniref:hypothetical protein n=1 Tax=Nocardia alni TaxID=2815723 RepID=UPI001C2447DE|nr:hypothetical protein [Nocardia alni]
MSAGSEFKSIMDQLLANYKSMTASELEGYLVEALKPSGPPGSPSSIASQAQVYQNVQKNCSSALQALQGIGPHLIWQSFGADKAQQVIAGLIFEAGLASQAFGAANTALTNWADWLSQAQQNDAAACQGMNELLADLAAQQAQSAEEAHPIPVGMTTVLSAAGFCSDRLSVAQQTVAAAAEAASILGEFTEMAWAHQIAGPSGDPLAAVVTAATGGGNSAIVNPAVLARAAQQLENMTPAEQKSFDALLADCKSPAEAAYVWKALGAGYTVSQVQAFDAAIHPHGGDDKWLNTHLMPDITNDTLATYDGKVDPQLDTIGLDIYDQGEVGDCVAASTVVARASVDPVYMLGLTTGYGLPAPSDKRSNGMPPVGDDSAPAFYDRLQQAYAGGFDQYGTDSSSQAVALLDQPTGKVYVPTSLGSAADRQAAIPQIEAAVNSGQPVPIDIYGTSTNAQGQVEEPAHQVVIIGRAGAALEIYNPWGSTTWVSEKDFVDGTMGDVTSNSPEGGMPIPYEVITPQ